MPLLLPPKTSLTIATLAVLLLLPQWLPSSVPAAWRPVLLPWATVASLADMPPLRGEPAKADQPAGGAAGAMAAKVPAAGGPAVPAPGTEPRQMARGSNPRVIVPPSVAGARAAALHLEESPGDLRRFYEALRETQARRGNRVTRIVHYGDSPTTADLITADTRALLQQQFGDAGHGFILIAKPWAWYGHQGVEVKGSGWQADAASQSFTRNKDGRYGLGGVSFRGAAGATSRITWTDPTHTRVEVAFLQQAVGGAFSVRSGDAVLGETETAGEDGAPGYASFPLPAGAKELTITVTRGPVRVFGAQLAKDGPGVVYDSLGLNGAYVMVLSRFFNESHWAAQLRHYQPDLVVINYGTNESLYADFVEKQMVGELREAIRRVRAAVPESSILVMSMMDRGQKDGRGGIVTPPTVPRLIELQRQLAAETGCAFFNTFAAMGGEGTMQRWYTGKPRLVGADFIHPMPAGARKVGELLHQALREGYERHRKGGATQPPVVASR